MVSIIVPVYNIKEYLPACIQSLQRQTQPNVEILLVDDGATDGSAELCDEYAAGDARIRVIHKANGGLSSARNAGVDAATGEWLLFVDGDDYLLEDAVERLLSVAKEHADADFIQFWYKETQDTAWHPEHPEKTELQACLQPKQFFEKLYALGGVGASACTKLYRRDVWKHLRFREGLRHEDEELMTRLLPQCKKVVYTNMVLYGYVMRAGSIVHSSFHPGHMDVFSVLEERSAVLEQLGYRDLLQETKQRMFETAARQYCLARKSGFHSEAKALKVRLKTMAKEEINGLSGQYKLLHKLTGITGIAPVLYYYARRICGKQ